MYISMLCVLKLNLKPLFVYKKLMCFYKIIDIFIVLSLKKYKIDNRLNASILDLIKQKIRNAMHSNRFLGYF